MQEWDVVKIETELMKDMVSRLLCEVLNKKKGYSIIVHINELTAMNDDKRIHIHLDINAEISITDLKKICQNSSVLSLIALGIVRLFSNKTARTYKYHIAEKIIKRSFQQNVDIRIKDMIINETKSRFYFQLNTDIEMKKERIEIFLENACLI